MVSFNGATFLPGNLTRAVRSFLAFAFFITLTLLSPAQGVHARAPGFAVTLSDTAIFVAPDATSGIVANLSSGSTVVLTGDSAPGFIEVTFEGSTGWAIAGLLSVSGRPGIDTAVATVDTPLLDAPIPEANVVRSVPAGESVILTGATVGDYDAASHDGAGGWIDRLNIVRQFRS